MQIFWNDDLLDTTQGLDILGIRGLDQSIEIGMVNGITTISQRIRYLSILTWALGEFLTARANDAAEWEDVQRFLRRVEFLVLVSTRLDREITSSDATGTLGANVFQETLTSFFEHGFVEIPEDRGGGMLGTYLGPCRSAGLLLDGAPPVFYQLTPRGREIWECRNHKLAKPEFIHLLNEGGTLTRELAENAIADFSLSALPQRPEEASLLKTAMLTPWQASNDMMRNRVETAYGNLQDTVAWAKGYFGENPSSAADVIVRNYKKCCAEQNCPEVALTWAEYEYRRRCHLALELLMSGLNGSLKNYEQASIAEIVADWETASEATDYLADLWPAVLSVWVGEAKNVLGTVPNDLFFGEQMPSGQLRQLPAFDQALMGVAIMQATATQTTKLRQSGQINTQTGYSGDHAIDLISACGDKPFRQSLVDLLQLAAMAHLQTTLRKMGAGQKCSLRFFPEGPALRPTGLDVTPGHSGDRLTNVCRFLTDIGELRAGSKGLELVGAGN